ncbi:MAG: hypothetical protein P8107_02010 [Spirochaetia bacterium]
MAALQLSQLVDISKPQYVITEVARIFSNHYKKDFFRQVKKNFDNILDLFAGKYKGYRQCNTEYHDFRHTMETFLATARLIDGYNLTRSPLDAGISANLLQAALFHDTGYIQEDWDKTGTGAKYTQEHVTRSIVFTEKNAEALGLQNTDVRMINVFISCSHLSFDFDKLTFAHPIERTAGSILGTSDLLGQMADRIYLEKLLFLYYEFREAGIPGYNTEFDIIRKTLDFYEMVKQKLDTVFNRVYEYAKAHFKESYQIDDNLYINAIENNVNYVKKIILDDATNFRTKLHRVHFTS